MNDPLLEEAREELRIMDFNFDEQEYYEGQQKMISDHNAAVEQLEREKAEIDTQKAKIEQKAQLLSKEKQEIERKKQEFETRNLETAKRLLGMGLNNEFIAIATMLSEDEIEKIRKEQ